MMSMSNSMTKSGGAAAKECAQSALFGGKYRLEELIGEGGMGSVWRARNVMLDLPVAVKLVHPAIRGKDATARLLTEARVEANLHHPGIVRVFDYGETRDGDAYIVMELLEGTNLVDILEQGRMPATQAVQLMLPVIHALHAAHRAGVIHRDLKPENIFLAQAGSHVQPKLLDFGIAKLSREPCPRVTKNGSLLGSPAYMAPEQARGQEDVDARADVWALCVVLYELISGQVAFDGHNQYAVLRAVIEHELPPLTEAESDGLWPILAAGLAKDPAQRTACAYSLGIALARWLVVQGETEDACGEPLAWNWQLTEPIEPLQPKSRRCTASTARARARTVRLPARSGLRLRPPATSSWGMIARAACLCATLPAIGVFVVQHMKDGPGNPRLHAAAHPAGVAARPGATTKPGELPAALPLKAASADMSLLAASAFGTSAPAKQADPGPPEPTASAPAPPPPTAASRSAADKDPRKAGARPAQRASATRSSRAAPKRSHAAEATLGLKVPF